MKGSYCTSVMRCWLLAGALHLPVNAADSGVAKLPTFLPPIPIGCLVRPECRLGLETQTSLAKLESTGGGSDMPAIKSLSDIPKELILDGLEPGVNIDLPSNVVTDIDNRISKKMGVSVGKKYLHHEQASKKCNREGEPELSARPKSVIQEVESYQRSEGFRRCVAAYGVLDEVREDASRNGRVKLPLLGLAYLRYIEACYAGTSTAIQHALNRYALLATDWPGPGRVFCAAFLLEPYILVTAKHCAIGDQPQNGPSPVPLKLFPGTYAFFPFSSSERFPVSVLPSDGSREQRSFEPKEPENDVAYLAVRHSAETMLPPFPIASPKDWDRLHLIGNFLSWPRIRDIQSGVSARRSSADELIKFDSSPICRIAKVKGRCIYHACQTVPGLSGSPLLAVSSTGSVKLVGVHAGSASENSPACGFRRACDIPNYGVALE